MKSKPSGPAKPDRALPAAKWIPILDAAGITPQALADSKTPHARAIKLGQWLSAKVGREMPVCVDGRNGKAVLRVIGARANEKRYYVEITWDRAKRPDTPKPPKGSNERPSKPKNKVKSGEKRQATTKPAGMRKTGGNDEEW